MFPSLLKNTGEGVTVGLLTAAGVILIYKNALPSAADIREGQPFSASVEGERKKAAWISTGLVAAVFLISRDVNSYLISGATLALVDYAYKHADAVHPATQKPEIESSSGVSIAPGMSEAAQVDDPYTMNTY